MISCPSIPDVEGNVHQPKVARIIHALLPGWEHSGIQAFSA